MSSASGSKGPHIARKRKPGQFVIIRTHEDGERIPLTIADVDKTRGAISIIVQGVGKSTRQLNAMNEGDAILDLAGPLGRPTEIASRSHGLLHRRRHRHRGRLPDRGGFKALHGHVTAIIGGRTKDFVILEKELRAVADQVIVTTDDGSYGEKGLVTDALRQLHRRGQDVRRGRRRRARCR